MPVESPEATARGREWCLDNAAYWIARADEALIVGRSTAYAQYMRFAEFWETAAD